MIEEITKTEETGILGFTLKELYSYLKSCINKNQSDYKLCIDDSCGHWYWLEPNFKINHRKLDGEPFVEVAIGDSFEDHCQPLKSNEETKASIKEIFDALSKFLTDENENFKCYAEYDCHKGGGLDVPSQFKSVDNYFGFKQITLSY